MSVIKQKTSQTINRHESLESLCKPCERFLQIEGCREYIAVLLHHADHIQNAAILIP